MLSFLRWVDETVWSTALHESLYMYPLVESTHVLTLMLFVGMTVMWDLRLLGLAFTNIPISDVSKRILPWSRIGFIIMIVTGALLFYAIPVRNYQNVFFRIKMILFALALLNIWYFHKRTESSIAEWDTAARPPRAVRLAAVGSISLWFLIVVAGRMIAYNWFDCDIQPQSDFINWAAGCVVPPAE
jgi:uncharacterized membrane protein